MAAALNVSVMLRKTSIGKTAAGGTSARRLIGGAGWPEWIGSRCSTVSASARPAVATPSTSTASNPPK